MTAVSALYRSNQEQHDASTCLCDCRHRRGTAKFAGEGFDIALISRTEKGSSAAAEAVARANAEANVRFFAADATQSETVEQALVAVAGDMSDVDVLI